MHYSLSYMEHTQQVLGAGSAVVATRVIIFGLVTVILLATFWSCLKGRKQAYVKGHPTEAHTMFVITFVSIIGLILLFAYGSQHKQKHYSPVKADEDINIYLSRQTIRKDQQNIHTYQKKLNHSRYLYHKNGSIRNPSVIERNTADKAHSDISTYQGDLVGAKSALHDDQTSNEGQNAKHHYVKIPSLKNVPKRVFDSSMKL